MTRLDPAILARHHRRNRLQTIGVLAGIGAWMALVGWLLAGVPGVVWALAGTGLLLLIQPVRSPLHPHRVHHPQPGAGGGGGVVGRGVFNG